MLFVYLVLFFFGAILCFSFSVISYFYVLPPESRSWSYDRMQVVLIYTLDFFFSLVLFAFCYLNVLYCDRKAVYLLKIVLDINYRLKFCPLDFNGIFLRLCGKTIYFIQVLHNPIQLVKQKQSSFEKRKDQLTHNQIEKAKSRNCNNLEKKAWWLINGY